MADEIKEQAGFSPANTATTGNESPAPEPSTKISKSKAHNVDKESPGQGTAKRRCVSTACIACRKRKSKCDGNTPSCAACSSVYNTECVYDPNSDHRRKGVYKKDIDSLKTRNSTLQTLVEAILNYPEHEIPDLVKRIRTCESLDDVAESIIARNNALEDDDDSDDDSLEGGTGSFGVPRFERELSGKLGKMRLDNGSLSIIGGTSNLIFLNSDGEEEENSADELEEYPSDAEPIASWTQVTSDARLIMHLLNMYFTWHYTYFTTLSKSLFWRDFKQGKAPNDNKRKTAYCTPLLVNAMLALGCHFTSWSEARANPEDSATAGDHFFKEAKRLILENDEHENPRLATVQALALMSVREAGCGREARGWVYSGMSFRMACDLGLNIESGASDLDESEVDARRMTIWGCFLFDKCWSNYLGRQPQLPLSSIATPKFDVFPMEEAEIWRPYFDGGATQSHAQPSRTRAIALQISLLCEISGDLLLYFYHPNNIGKPQGKQAELKKLSELHTRLEAWKKNLPKELEPREGQLPSVLVMHMFFQLLFIHLFRPFLRYKPANSPLPAHVSPRKFLTHAAAAISKLLRLYRRTHGLRQICNVAVYISHMACTVHVLNLPDKNAARDLVYGLSHLEEISESWLCARRTLGILRQVSRRWNVDLPEAAEKTFEKVEAKFGVFKHHDFSLSPKSEPHATPMLTPIPRFSHPESTAVPHAAATANNQMFPVVTNGNYLANTTPLTNTPPPVIQHPDGTLSLPPQEAAELTRISRQHAYVLPHAALQQQQQQQNDQYQNQQDYWAQQQQHQQTTNQQSGGRQTSRYDANRRITSPTLLFSDADSSIHEHHDQEWWLHDSHSMFANWNGYEQHDLHHRHPAPHDYFNGLATSSHHFNQQPFDVNGGRKDRGTNSGGGGLGDGHVPGAGMNYAMFRGGDDANHKGNAGADARYAAFNDGMSDHSA